MGFAELEMLGRYHYRKAHEGLLPHAHSGALEICYMEKGRQLYRVGGQAYVLTGGDVFVTFPGEMHSSGESPEEKGIMYWLILNLPEKKGDFLNLPSPEGWNLARSLRHLPNRYFTGQPEMKSALDNMIAVAPARRDPLRRLKLQSHVVDFLLRVVSCSQTQAKPKVSGEVKSLMAYIQKNVCEPLSVPVLAEQLKLSEPRFKVRFRQETGMPPAEYVLRCKVEEAVKRLGSRDANATDVAHDLNFSSSQHFATVVRRYTGRTPSDFMKGRGSIK